MKRAVLSAALAVLFASIPANAHHVPVSEAASDSDALAIFVTEYTAQRQAVVEAYQLFLASQSAPEAADALDAFRAGVETTILHLESLDTPECAAILRGLALEEFAAIARYIATSGENPSLAQVHLSTAGLLAQQVQTQVAPSVVECTGEAP